MEGSWRSVKKDSVPCGPGPFVFYGLGPVAVLTALSILTE